MLLLYIATDKDKTDKNVIFTLRLIACNFCTALYCRKSSPAHTPLCLFYIYYLLVIVFFFSCVLIKSSELEGLHLDEQV